MKRILSIALAAVMVLCAAALSASAFSITDLATAKATTLTQVLSGIDIGADEVLDFGQYCMRGFTASPDGKYLFGGFLNPSNASAIVMWDNTTGLPAGYYQFKPTEGTDKVSYPKGLACDDRGYLYAGLAYNPNNSYAHLNIIKYTEKGTDDFMKTVSSIQVITTDSSTKTGVNGVAVENLNGSYYAYVVVNYDVDYLYRFDVTDPEKPVIDTAFGDSGRVDLKKIQTSTGFVTEGNYLDVDDDGSIYLGFTSESGSGLLKLSADGKTLLGDATQTKGYGVAVYNNFVLCSTQTGPSEICVYEKTSLTKLGSFTLSNDNIALPYDEKLDLMTVNVPNSICNLIVCDGCLFLADQGTTALPDQVFAIALDQNGAAILQTAVAARVALAQKKTETTAEVTTEAPVVTTAAEEVTTAEVTTAEEVAATTVAEITTAPVKSDEKGCKGFVSAAAVIALLPAALVFVKKKKTN